MSGPRTNAAFYAAPVEEFLAASEEEVYAPLASPHGYTLAPEQQSAWRLQLPVLRAALEELVAPPPAAPVPIFPEKRLPRVAHAGPAGDGDLRPAGCQTRQDPEPGVLRGGEPVSRGPRSATGLGRPRWSTGLG
jgi:hypothetical protein